MTPCNAKSVNADTRRNRCASRSLPSTLLLFRRKASDYTVFPLFLLSLLMLQKNALNSCYRRVPKNSWKSVGTRERRNSEVAS